MPDGQFSFGHSQKLLLMLVKLRVQRRRLRTFCFSMSLACVSQGTVLQLRKAQCDWVGVHSPGESGLTLGSLKCLSSAVGYN